MAAHMPRQRAAVLVLLLAALTACGEKHYFSVDMAGNTTRVDADGHPLAGATAPAPPPGMDNPHGAAADGPPAAGPLTGTITLDPSLHVDLSHFKCVFLIARRDPGKPADAVRKISPVSFPLKFELSNGDGTHGGGLADGEYVVTARLDSDGDAMAAEGDVQGVSPVMRPGGAPATIVLDQMVTAEMAAAHAIAPMAGGGGGAGAAPFAPFAGGAASAPTPEDLAGPRFKGRVELAPEFAALAGKYPLFHHRAQHVDRRRAAARQAGLLCAVPARLRHRDRERPDEDRRHGADPRRRREDLRAPRGERQRQGRRRRHRIGAAGGARELSAARAAALDAEDAVNPALAAAHRAALMSAMQGGVAVACTGRELIRNRDTHFRFRPDSDFWYLTGFREPDAVAVLRPEASRERFVLFVRPRDLELETWNGRRAGVEGAIAQ